MNSVNVALFVFLLFIMALVLNDRMPSYRRAWFLKRQREFQSSSFSDKEAKFDGKHTKVDQEIDKAIENEEERQQTVYVQAQQLRAQAV